MNNSIPRRGEIWFADFNPTKGREQSGKRPCVILSVDRFNRSGANLVLVCPITTRERHIPTHVCIKPPEGGLHEKSFIKCEDLRSISQERLSKKLGNIASISMKAIEERIRLILGLA